MGTFDGVLARCTRLHSPKPTSVEKEKSLFSIFESCFEFFQKKVREVGKPFVLLKGFLHVDDFDIGQRGAAGSF